MPDDFEVLPLTPERWPDLELLFGPQGACYGCWCTYFRLTPPEREAMDGAAKRAFMQARVAAGQPPGVVGYLAGEPVGWVQVGPRFDVPRWNGTRTVSQPLMDGEDRDPALFAISCFFVRSSSRGKGLSHQLLDGAVRFASGQGATRIDACPIDHAKHSKSVGLFVGPSSIFNAAGYIEIARRKDGRPLMRLALAS